MIGDDHHDSQPDIAARLERLPWSRFHRRAVFALGITWILDGLEVTLVGALAPLLTRPAALALTARAVGLLASSYLAGAVLGSLVFGHLADRSGRKRLFTVTLVLYIAATAASGLAWNFASLALFRFLTGAGIGGEYSAINSAIQELVPAERRGRVDLIVNGSFWLGAAAAAGLNVVLLAPGWLPVSWAWRLAFLLGAALGLIALLLRRHIPESPRWLQARGRLREAQAAMSAIEAAASGLHPSTAGEGYARSAGRPSVGLAATLRVILCQYPRRALLGGVLMTAQAFFYNAFFFTYALVLVRFLGVRATHVGFYLWPFALSNFLGAASLARFFDTIGRRAMMVATYGLSGLLMIAAAWMFRVQALNGFTQTLAWAGIFFFASAGASGAYLTVSESFPIEVRARAIGLFYAFGTAVGGVLAPALFTTLIASGSRTRVFYGYLLAAVLMLIAAGVEGVLGFAAERRPLEALTAPLTAPPPRPTSDTPVNRDS